MQDLLSPGHIIGVEYIIAIFLLITFISSFISAKIKIPYILVLLFLGISISVFHALNPQFIGLKGFKIDPKIILYFVIPPLIFEAMMRIDYKEFKMVQAQVLVLAVVGTVFATLITGFVLYFLVHLNYAVAFGLAAIIAPTDAVIVIEVFKRLKVPKLLSTTMEAEASFNDAVVVIIFSSIIALFLVNGGSISPEDSLSIDLISNIENFGISFGGGILVGLAFSVVGHQLHKLVNNQLSETSLTMGIVFGSVVTATALGVSGLIAVAIAGLYFGNITTKQEQVISQKVRQFAGNFWEMVAFFANSIAFLYLGLSLDLAKIGQDLPLILLCFVSVLIGRAASAYPLLAITNRFAKFSFPRQWKNVVFIGGMRGALSVALVATLPEGELKSTLQTLTFGVILASLFIQYPILDKYVKRIFSEPNSEHNP